MKINYNKYILSFFLVLLCSLQVSAANFSGSGTASDPYIINSLYALREFAESVYNGTSYEGKYFKQTGDIVVNNGVISKTDGTFNEAEKASFKSWKPAGRVYGMFTKKSFKGNYDGNNYTIWGLYFGDDMDEPYVGLFGYAEKAIIQNLTIRESYMGCKAAGSYNDDYHGFIAGYAPDCTFINCHVVNSIIDIKNNNELSCGGLVGCTEAYNSSNAMKNCSFSGKINIQSQDYDISVGGLVGKQVYNYTFSTVVEGCSVDGTLDLKVDFSKSCKKCIVAGLLADAAWVDMYESVNRMNFNVSSVNFTDYPDDYMHTKDYKTFIDRFSHMKQLRIYSMCGAVGNMANCANFGDVNIGKDNFLGPIDDIVVAPVAHLYETMKSCAFYGVVNVGVNGYYYQANPWDQKDTWQDLFSLKVYTVSPEIYSKVIISRVLRREDGTSKTDDDVPYLTDQKTVPSGVTLYATTDLTNIIKDAKNIIENFSGYDETDKKTYKWGVLADDDTFRGCPVPMVLGGEETGLIGDGTMLKPYIIQDARDYIQAVTFINTMDDSSDKYFKLLADIDLSNCGKLNSIGDIDHPFKGTFDGNGHAIIGLNLNYGYGSMFANVKGGYIKNLTLLDMTCLRVAECSPLVENLTDNNGNRGCIQNCYVGGTINVSMTPNGSAYSTYIAGLCGTCNGGQICNSYFKGKFNVTADQSSRELYIGGICNKIEADNSINSRITDCYSVFDYTASGFNKVYPYGIACVSDKISEDVLEQKNLYYMTNSEDVNTQNGTRATSYADMNMSNASGFIEGVYNPVLPNTKSYKLEDGRGLDAILVDGEGTGDNANVILHYVPSAGEDYQSDRYLWQHPNLAVYNADDDAEYLINCTLDNAKDLQLNMDHAKSQTIKANMHYPVSIYSLYDNKPLLQMLCLPVTIQRDALPEGSKLKIVGTKSFDTTNNYFISTMVECDSVPAGVPFLLEIPAEATSGDKKATYDIVLRGKVAPEPVSTIKVGDLSMQTELKGTYVSYKKPNQFTYRDECEAKDGYYDVYKYDNTVSPFHAYAVVEGETSSYNYEYRLVDNLLLDEQSNNVASMLDTYNGKTADVILKRSMKKDVWNTVCLPFDMSAAEIAKAFGTGTIVEELARVENTDGATIVFATTSDMKAGKTYLVKPAQNGSLYNLADRTITNVLASEPDDATYDTYFKGTYAPILLEGTAAQTGDGYSYNYFIQSNKLYYLPEGQAVAMKGFRGWILIASNSLFGTDGNATNAKLMHCDGSTTDVRAIEYGTTANGKRIYDLQGIEHKEMQKGVNIIGGKKIMK